MGFNVNPPSRGEARQYGDVHLVYLTYYVPWAHRVLL